MWFMGRLFLLIVYFEWKCWWFWMMCMIVSGWRVWFLRVFLERGVEVLLYFVMFVYLKKLGFMIFMRWSVYVEKMWRSCFGYMYLMVVVEILVKLRSWCKRLFEGVEVCFWCCRFVVCIFDKRYWFVCGKKCWKGWRWVVCWGSDDFLSVCGLVMMFWKWSISRCFWILFVGWLGFLLRRWNVFGRRRVGLLRWGVVIWLWKYWWNWMIGIVLLCIVCWEIWVGKLCSWKMSVLVSVVDCGCLIYW